MPFTFNPISGKLDYYERGTSYALPTASAGTLGGIKVGTRLSIDGNGVLSADVQAGGGDTVAPATNTADYIPQWNGANSKTLKDGLAVPAGGLAGITALNLKLDSSAFSDAGVTGKLITGFISGAGAVAATDTILQAIDKLDGNVAGKATALSGTLNEIAYFNTTTTIASLSVATYPSLTELSYVKGVTSAIQTQIGTKAPSTAPTFATSITGSYLTASEILITDASKNIVSAAVATYPSLTEFSYVKGVSSSIQTQINGKAATLSGTINELTYFSSSSSIASLAVATYPSLTELSYVKGVSSAIQTQINAKGVGDMTLAGVQSVTGLKTFDTTKLAVKGSSTGTTAIASANAGATGYTQTLQTRDGTIANLDNVTYIGTTSVALNRASAALTLAGITLTTPDIGTPSSGNLSNCTALPASSLTSATLAGSINLGEGADPATIGLVIDGAMSADERYSGITVPGTAGVTLAFGDLCYLDVTATEWLLADASAAATAGAVILGICVDASTDGNATSMLLIGTVRSAAFPASIALGAPVYISETSGDITATQPTTTDAVIRVCGFAVTVEPNTILFSPSSDWISHT